MAEEDVLDELSDDSLSDDLTSDDSLGGLNDFDDFDLGDDKSPMNKYSDLLKQLTDFDPIIQSRIRNWLGLEFDDKLQDYVQKKSAIINEKGARWAIGCLQTYQAKTNIITKQRKNNPRNNKKIQIFTKFKR